VSVCFSRQGLKVKENEKKKEKETRRSVRKRKRLNFTLTTDDALCCSFDPQQGGMKFLP